MKKRMIAAILSFVLALGQLPATAGAQGFERSLEEGGFVLEDGEGEGENEEADFSLEETDEPEMMTNTESVTYLKFDGTADIVEAEIVEGLGSGDTWGNNSDNPSYYVVKDNVTINGDILLQGTVSLILMDGASLTVEGSIQADPSEKNKVTFSVYSQSMGNEMGYLTVNQPDNNVYDSAIGWMSGFSNSMDINICGGSVTARGGKYGIGGDEQQKNPVSTVKIYGGYVQAIGKSEGIHIAGNKLKVQEGSAYTPVIYAPNSMLTMPTQQAQSKGVIFCDNDMNPYKCYGKDMELNFDLGDEKSPIQLTIAENRNRETSTLTLGKDATLYASKIILESKTQFNVQGEVLVGEDGEATVEKKENCSIIVGDGGKFYNFAPKKLSDLQWEGATAKWSEGNTNIKVRLYKQQTAGSLVPVGEWMDLKESSQHFFEIPEAGTYVFGVKVYNSTGAETEEEQSVPKTFYQVTFDPQGGSVVSEQFLGEGDRIIQPEDPKKAGYTFAGWYRDAALSQRWNFETDVVPKDGITLYAGWARNVMYYTLTFETNGGSALPAQVRAEGSLIDLTEYVPVREGYVFCGWYADSQLTQKTEAVRMYASQTLYAKWEEEKPEIVVPDVPGVRMEARTENSASISWEACEGADGYTIWVRDENDSQYTRKYIHHGNEDLTYTWKNLEPGTKHFFIVRSWVQDEEGAYHFSDMSATVRVTTKPEPAKIQEVTVNENGDIKVRLKKGAEGATHYAMCWSRHADYSKYKVGIWTIYPTRTITKGMSPGIYYIKVRAYRDLGTSKVYADWSDPVKVVVK